MTFLTDMGARKILDIQGNPEQKYNAGGIEVADIKVCLLVFGLLR